MALDIDNVFETTGLTTPAKPTAPAEKAVGHYTMAKVQLAAVVMESVAKVYAAGKRSDACDVAVKAAGLVFEQEMKALMNEDTAKEYAGVPNPSPDEPQG